MSAATNGEVTTTIGPWNTTFSKSDAIAMVRRISLGDPGDVANTDVAKLMTYGDFQHASAPDVVTPATPDSLRVWAVEEVGRLTVSMGGPESWGIWLIDSHNGSTIGLTAGPSGTSPSYWNDLPDHSA
jgi:hypothetical protein